MTVGELIELLTDAPDDTQIYCWAKGTRAKIDAVALTFLDEGFIELYLEDV